MITLARSGTRAKAVDSWDWMWNAVVGRDGLADGAFVYGVKSTGVFCRPSCPSRRPASRERVEFFESCDEAERAGYRGCFRCRPEAAGIWQRDLLRVQAACRVLEREGAGRKSEVSLEQLAKKVGGVSSFHLQKCFKRVLGISPKQYGEAVRLRSFRAMLREGEKVGVAARASGFSSPGRLYAREARAGVLPSVYRDGGEGASIDYAVVECPLGFMLVAATEKGVCAIKLGDEVVRLKAGLVEEFPRAVLREDGGSLGPFLLAALSAVGVDAEASVAAGRLPLDIRATAFQQRVWAALRSIPFGEVRSYGEIAASLGAPGASRAVGSACGANAVALSVPCHRAVRGDGGISGYRWGVGRKESLLKHEAAVGKRK